MVQSIAYFTGFETGDASEIVSTIGAGNSIQTTTVKTGGYALQLGAAGTEIQYVGALSATQMALRCAFRFDTTPPTGDNTFFRILSGATLLCGIALNATSKLEVTDSAALVTAGTDALAANTWYRVELTWASAGAIKVYIDGNIEINTTDTGAGGTAGQVNGRVDTATSLFLDDIRFDVGGTTPIGLGQCIARQGIAGTPTYNAWTKNGAATAALCWSETPFSATKNCSDSVLNDAQTMLVGKFSTAGSAPEGAQTIGGDDTINAVKVGMIAKTAVVGNINLRRRVASTDTDTVIALTTNDAYYQTALFTDTVTNLDAYEIGVKNALIATAETVEDMWMMVDYTPVPVNAPDLSELSIYMPTIRRNPVMIAY